MATRGANFRAYPSLDAAAIQGVVLAGDPVQLTGHTVFADGVFWYEAKNELPLALSSEPHSNNQLDRQQVGWIAECFVND
ncbi:MAG: SH3 domain-containing protein [Leptolyngbya sp. LCM1.Bin17]|nr:MAG: SH3 domain-containing protein [Leptolyngbya sp. LCM1.Bin17]